MKKIFYILACMITGCLALCTVMTANAQNSKKNDNVMSNKKTLVAYFSATGTTMEAASKLAKVANADLHEIIPEVPYTPADLNWRDKSSRSTVEMENKSSRPAIANRVENMEQYDTVFVGYPIWWYIAPTIINTFLEQYDLTGKTVVPFFTSGGSGAGQTMKYLKPSAPGANWVDPKNLNYMGEAEMKNWIDSL
ncbi:MAG: NAD(P)H-dependent oxidoreductase [Muribaculaceae bacterium]|nr:NAD(P)H-dependent oxidoreductase [Muribaculaceae bacterium]